MLDGLKPAFEKLKAMPPAKQKVMCNFLSRRKSSFKDIMDWLQEDPKIWKEFCDEFFKLLKEEKEDKNG